MVLFIAKHTDDGFVAVESTRWLKNSLSHLVPRSGRAWMISANEKERGMIKVNDGVAEYRWARRVGPPVDLNELASMCRYRANSVASVLGISCRQLERDFRKYLGVTPKYWLREQRALRAVLLIHQGGELSAVAKELGFKRYGHFSREMRAFFGVRPVELVE